MNGRVGLRPGIGPENNASAIDYVVQLEGDGPGSCEG